MGKNVGLPYAEYGFERKKEGGRVFAICLNCPYNLTNCSRKRMQSHLSKCKKEGRSSATTATVYSSDEDSDENDEPPAKAMRSCENTPSSSQAPASSATTPIGTPVITGSVKRNQTKMARFTDIMSKKEGEAAQQLLANCFYGGRIPFRFVEDYHFKKFILTIRPGMAPYLPCRQTLAGSLLDKSIKKYEAENKSEFPEKYCVLFDGWKNKVSKDKWFCFVLHNASGKSMYLKSALMTGVSETAENLCEEVRKL